LHPGGFMGLGSGFRISGVRVSGFDHSKTSDRRSATQLASSGLGFGVLGFGFGVWGLRSTSDRHSATALATSILHRCMRARCIAVLLSALHLRRPHHTFNTIPHIRASRTPTPTPTPTPPGPEHPIRPAPANTLAFTARQLRCHRRLTKCRVRSASRRNTLVSGVRGSGFGVRGSGFGVRGSGVPDEVSGEERMPPQRVGTRH
jgi:hypothetical protein